MEKRFHELLRDKMDEFVHLVYKETKYFPREELYGTISQLRRASLSIILNYIEGFARKKILVKVNFFEISFGSLKESTYLLEFAFKESWLKKDRYMELKQRSEEIAAMLWKTISNLSNEP